MPARIVDGGVPAQGLIVQILVAKYSDHLPLYGQESIYARAGVGLSRQTMGDWVGAAGAALAPLVAAMREALLKQDVIRADETTVKLLSWRRPKNKDKNRHPNEGGHTVLPVKRRSVISGSIAAPVWIRLYKNLLS